MPTSRRSSGRAPAAGSKQSTLSFNHRVTKSVPKSVKDSVISSSITKKDLPEEKPKEEVADAVVVEPEITQPEEEVEVPEKSESELKAAQVTDAAIERYWRKLEAERRAKRVHQEDLATSEKVLRYFDVSSQYGPCIGITRLKRWQRADRLGLNPPIEVLAVLIKEEAKATKTSERAHIDEILNSTAVSVE